MKHIALAIFMASVTAGAQQPTPEQRKAVDKFIRGEPGVVVNLLALGYEPHAWKLFQLSPAGSAMYRHPQRDFVIAVRKSQKLHRLTPGMSIAGTVKAKCLEYVGSNSYRTVSGFQKNLRVYEIGSCK